MTTSDGIVGWGEAGQTGPTLITQQLIDQVIAPIYGDKAGLEWHHEDMNYLRFTMHGEPPRRLSRSGVGSTAAALHASRVPAGLHEGYIEGFAQLYSDLADQILARKEGREPDPTSLLVPGIDEGVDGMRFIAGVLDSSARKSAWVKL